jgi:Nuclease-related domain
MTNFEPAAPALLREADVAEQIDAIEGVVALHDRAIPGSRADIDHIVIAPSGVYVVDTNISDGTVERRDNRLFVGMRDRTDLPIAMSHRVEAVSSALRDLRVPISRALCFVGAVWAPTTPPFLLRGVWIGPPVQLYRLVSQPGLLQPGEIETAARMLEERFRSIV